MAEQQAYKVGVDSGKPGGDESVIVAVRPDGTLIADVGAELNRLSSQLAARDAEIVRLRAAIQKAIDDDETGKWGPDITVKGDLIAALKAE